MRSMLKKHLKVGCAAVATLALSSAVAMADHCNSYRGPAGQVPPTGRTPSDPTPPAGGGGTTGGAGGAGGVTGGFGGPGATTAGPGAARGGVSRGLAPRGGKKGSGAEGFERWEFWWEYNKDALLNLRSRLGGRDLATSGGADFFLGNEDKSKARNVTRPTERLVREKVVPELVKATTDKYYLVRDAATIALGKIGDPTMLPVIMGMLKDEHRDVQESAALALGMLGNHEALPTLISLMNDDDNAHKVTGRREILTRTRAFAAVGIGLLGDEQAVPELMKAMDRNESQKDVQVCATVALGGGIL